MFGKKSYAEVFFAELDGVPAGFTVFFHNFSTFVGKPGLYIEDIFVKPEFRGKGIGKAMFLHCVKLAKERNCGRMEWAVLDWNPAREFYEYFGGGPCRRVAASTAWARKNSKVRLKNKFERVCNNSLLSFSDGQFLKSYPVIPVSKTTSFPDRAFKLRASKA